jgi:hypothetical protein
VDDPYSPPGLPSPGAGGTIGRVVELELQRAPEHRRVYALDGVGTLRLAGLARRRATAQAGGRRYEFARRRRWSGALDARDEAGVVVGTFDPRGFRGGGTLRWNGQELRLRPASRWRSRYALADGEQELVVLDGKGWGKRPVSVTLDAAAAVDPGLLLFAAFVVRGLAEDAGAAVAAVT